MSDEYELEEIAPWLVVLLTLVAGFMRVFMLGVRGMWLDETFSVWLANHSVTDMLQWIARIDQHPPLYYLLLHYWIAHYGDTPYYARLLSVLFGAGTIPFIYLIGKRLSGEVMGLVAAVLLTVSPFNIHYAQETRMYTLLAFNAAVATYALVRLLTDPRSTRPIGSQFLDYLRAWLKPPPAEPGTTKEFSYMDEIRYLRWWRAWISRYRWLPIQAIETDLAWAAFIVFSAATMLSHNTAVFFPIATNLFVLGLMLFQRSKKPAPPPALQAPSFLNWGLAQVGIFLLWSPWLLTFINQASRVYQEFWLPAPGWNTVIQALASFMNFSILGQSSLMKVIWIVYALVLCLGLWHYRKSMAPFLFLAALFAVPFLGELVVSIRRPVFLDRTLIWTTIPLFLLLAAGIAQLRYRLPILVVLGILGTNNLFSDGDYYRFMQKEEWNTAAGYVANFAQKDDLVLFNASWVQIPFDYYFKAFENQYSIQVEKHGLPVDMFDRGILEPKMAESDIPRLISLMSGHNRIWLVYSHNWYTDPQGLIPQTLAAQMTLLRKRDFYGGQVQLYGTP